MCGWLRIIIYAFNLGVHTLRVGQALPDTRPDTFSMSGRA
jgi:hypothetical protein